MRRWILFRREHGTPPHPSPLPQGGEGEEAVGMFSIADFDTRN